MGDSKKLEDGMKKQMKIEGLSNESDTEGDVPDTGKKPHRKGKKFKAQSRADNRLLDYALRYAELGWSIVPVPPRSKIPYVKWKAHQKIRPTHGQIQDWWNEHPKANVGLITGSLSGVIVMDFDSSEAVDQYQATIGEIPQSITSKTGRDGGGTHVFLKHPGFYVKSQHSKTIDKFDVKGDAGIIILPPSLHKSGVKYEWGDIDPTEMGLDDLLDVPIELIATFGDTDPKTGEKVSGNPEGWMQDMMLNGVKEGKRNVSLTRVAGFHARYYEGMEDIVTAKVFQFNHKFVTPPLDEAAINKIAKSVCEKYNSEKDSGEKIEEEVAYRESAPLEKMNELFSLPMKQPKKYVWPDGTVKYGLTFKVKNEFFGMDEFPLFEPGEEHKYVAVMITTDVLLSLAKMSLELASIYNLNIKSIVSAKEWASTSNRILKCAEVTPMGLEESELANVAELIATFVFDTDRASKDINMLPSSGAVLRQDVISGPYTVITCVRSVARCLEAAGHAAMDRKEIAVQLGKLGFKKMPGRPRINGVRTVTWEILASEFIKNYS